MNNEERRVKAETTKQIAQRYGVSEKIVRNWIEPIQHLIGPRIGHYYTPRQVDLIDKFVGSTLLLVFGSFFTPSQAVAGTDLTYANTNANFNLNNIKNPAFMISEASSFMYPVLFFMGLVIWFYCLAFKIENVIKRFIDTPQNRELARVRSQDNGARVRDVFQITSVIIQVTIASVGTFIAGYWIGILTF